MINDIYHRRKPREEDLFKVKNGSKKDDMHWLDSMLKSKPKRYRDGGFGGSNRAFIVNKYGEKAQRVMFKMSYNGSMAAHLKYLETYMPQLQKDQVLEKPQVFGTPDIEYKGKMTGNHFKLILSPESQDVPLDTLAKEFIKRLETLTDFKLLYRAAIHTDTAHHHVHLCINGVDKDGKPVRFPKEMIKSTMREVASYITTQLVGERTQEQIISAKQGLTQSMRWTALDERLLCNEQKLKCHDPTLDARLAFLLKAGLATTKDDVITVNKDFQEVLTATGRYNNYLKYYQDYNGKLELYTGGGIKGTIKDVITFDKDESWNDAIIVATNDGKNIYVPVWQLKKQGLKGSNIQINTGDRALSRQVKDKDIIITSKPQKPRQRTSPTHTSQG